MITRPPNLTNPYHPYHPYPTRLYPARPTRLTLLNCGFDVVVHESHDVYGPEPITWIEEQFILSRRRTASASTTTDSSTTDYSTSATDRSDPSSWFPFPAIEAGSGSGLGWLAEEEDRVVSTAESTSDTSKSYPSRHQNIRLIRPGSAVV